MKRRYSYSFFRVIAAVAVIAVVTTVLFNCGGARDISLLEQAWAYNEADDFELMHVLARAYAIRHPRSAAAHYLLGRCYANRKVPELTRAKGEFDTAAFLLQDPAQLDVPDPDVTINAFRALLHHETALVLVRTAVEARKAGIPPRATTGILNTALEQVREGLRLVPHSGELAALEQHLLDTLGQITGDDHRPAPGKQPRFI